MSEASGEIDATGETDAVVSPLSLASVVASNNGLAQDEKPMRGGSVGVECEITRLDRRRPMT
jgi:hypothetical protein